MSIAKPPQAAKSALQVYAAGIRASVLSVFACVLFGTFIGIGALAHDFGFSLGWLLLSTVLIWAGPAQVILISMLGSGAAPIEIALAVSLSGVRLLPMAVALLPILRVPGASFGRLLLPAHFTAVSMWIESIRLAPQWPREERVAFCNGLGTGYMTSGLVAAAAGFYLAAKLPALLTAGLLFLTPISFLVSAARNARLLVDKLALALGLVIGPLLAYSDVRLDILWTGIVGGTIAYGVHRLRGSVA